MTLARLRALFAVEGIAFGLLMPFPVPLLDERGMGPAQIGLILSVAGLVSLLAYPLWGAIADGWLGRPRTLALTALVAALGGAAILWAGDDPLLLTLSLSLILVGVLSWGPLTDALTLAELGERSHQYGRIRLWASAGWAASAVTAGAIWSVTGPEPVFVAFILGALLLALLVLWPAPAREGAVIEAVTPSAARGSERAVPRPSLRTWLPALLTPVLLGFLVALLITSLGEHASWRYIGLRILDQGGGVFLVGLAASLPALVEIPVFGASRRLAPWLGLRGLFVGGALGAAVIMALVAVAPEPWMVTTLRTLEGSAYALRYMGMVLVVGVLVPRHLYAMGQSVAWFVHAGIAPVIADAAGGIIYDAFGAAALFLAATAALSVGAAVAWLVLRGPAFGRHVLVPSVAEQAPAPPPPA